MSASGTVLLPPLAMPPEVVAFATEKAVTAYLADIAAMTRQIFPDVRIRAVLRDDPELSYNQEIVFEVDDAGMDADQLFHTTQRWSAELYQLCPSIEANLFGMSQVPLT